jgi:hypothetical protein
LVVPRENLVTAIILALNNWTYENKLARIDLYFAAYALTSLLVLYRSGLRGLLVSLAGLAAAIGFMVPHIVFGQAPIPRYTVNSSELLLMIMAFQIVTLGRLRLPQWDRACAVRRDEMGLFGAREDAESEIDLLAGLNEDQIETAQTAAG